MTYFTKYTRILFWLNMHFSSISFSFSFLQNSVEVPTQLTEDILQNFQVKVKKLTTLTPVWDSQGTSSHAQVSIWASKPLRSLLTKSRVSSSCFSYETFPWLQLYIFDLLPMIFLYPSIDSHSTSLPSFPPPSHTPCSLLFLDIFLYFRPLFVSATMPVEV